MDIDLCSKMPAEKFTEAYPIGNGTIGAMVYGGIPSFHLSLNLDTLWSGKPGKKDPLMVSENTRNKIRKLIQDERLFEAQELVQKTMLSKRYNESYVSAGFMDIEFEEVEEISEYSRRLCMEEACVFAEALTGTNRIQVKCFASLIDHCMIVEINAIKPITIKVKMGSALKNSIYTEERRIELYGEAPEHVEPQYVDCKDPIIYGDGMNYLLWAEVNKTDGECEETIGGLRIVKGTKIQLAVTGATGYRGGNHELENRKEVLQKECNRIIVQINGRTSDELLETHRKEYQRMFKRVELQLGKEWKVYEQLFQYGRYLMICSSYKEGIYSQPATLQGIWCEEIRPMWSCNWTTNINTEMNYWLTGPCALMECDWPLVEMIKELAVAGRETAVNVFGCEGWVTCHNVDLWRQTTPVKGNVKWSFWTMGGVWLATHLYAHFQYTEDIQFLRETAYPLMKGAARFCLDWTQYVDNELHSYPSTSPENTFLDNEGRECAICDSSTMDIALIREIWTETAEAAEVLGQDDDFITELIECLQKLPQYKIGSYGQLMEWNRDYPEKDPHHRHFAHLVGLHPFHQIDHDQRSEFLDAVYVTLRRRCQGMKQFIGWDEAWLVNFYARLYDGEEAFKHLERFASNCTYPNLFSLHPPLGENDSDVEVFQIDGNFGITAGIAEMLVQSKKETLVLLPALPMEWKDGKITGIRVIGGHTVEICWKENRLCQGSLLFGKTGMVEIWYQYPFVVEQNVDREMKVISSCQKKDGYYVCIREEKGNSVRFRMTC